MDIFSHSNSSPIEMILLFWNRKPDKSKNHVESLFKKVLAILHWFKRLYAGFSELSYSAQQEISIA